MILLDTNVVSELMRREPDRAAAAWVDARPLGDLHISSVTRAEIELGIALLPEGRRKHGLKTVAMRVFAEFHGRCLAFDERAASLYAGLMATRIHAGRPISVEDAQIAAVALGGGFTLATRNVADFAGIDGLAVVDPFTP
ncbi:MAG: type II toxin-antitoxin system VapC family toxin [Thermoleophilia bacterium]|nr:type II toxin-antitoxin system VapC family toxin [Thermoleophilia bacterium]